LKTNKLFILLGSAVFLVLVGLPFALWAADIWWSGPKGAGGLHKQVNDSTNRVAAAGSWQTYYDDVQRAKADLKAVESIYKSSSPEDDPQGFIISNKEQCVSAVTNYNGLNSQPLISKWKPASLPVSISSSVCK
jgi:hypothetical protein